MCTTGDGEEIMPTCANCGNGEEDTESEKLKTCSGCKTIKYCSADCQKAHRSQHKKACKKRAVELHDIKLFKTPPQVDCPICMLFLPKLLGGVTYNTCCGKLICSGCMYAVAKRDGGAGICPFCRTPASISEDEQINRLKKRAELGDEYAFFDLASDHREGRYGLPQDHTKALELSLRGGELGCATSYNNVGFAYFNGEGTKRDEKKGRHFWELAAMMGDCDARHTLGVLEESEGNANRAIKHYMIAVESGFAESLKKIQQLYTSGYASKGDYATALRAYQAYLDEIRSDKRDEAAAESGDRYKYY